MTSYFSNHTSNAEDMDSFYIAAAWGYDFETGEVFDERAIRQYAREGYPLPMRIVEEADVPLQGCRHPERYPEENTYMPCERCAWCVPPDTEIPF